VKKIGILNQDISTVIAGMGHTDRLVVSDAGLPIPENTRRIDLAVTNGIPGFLVTVKAIAEELKVEKIIVADEMKCACPQIYAALLDLFEGVSVELVRHSELKELCREAAAVVRTGEFTPYANVVLVSGVVF
jgi:D-ribose pyranase